MSNPENEFDSLLQEKVDRVEELETMVANLDGQVDELTKLLSAREDGEDGDERVDEWPIVVTLAVPVKLGRDGDEIKVITMTEPILRHTRGMSIGSEGVKFKDLVTIVSRATGHSVTIIEKLPGRYGSKFTGPAQRFLSSCLAG